MDIVSSCNTAVGHLIASESEFLAGRRRGSGWSGFNLTNFCMITIVSMGHPDQFKSDCYGPL